MTSRATEDGILDYLRQHGRVQFNELDREMNRRKIPRATFVRRLNALTEAGRIKKLRDDRKTFYESLETDLSIRIKKFIEDYNKENMSMPYIEEIAIEFGIPPTEAEIATYRIAREVNWFPPDPALFYNPRKPFGGDWGSSTITPLLREEIEVILSALENPSTVELASRRFSGASVNPSIVEHKQLFKRLTKILENPSLNIKESRYYLLISLWNISWKEVHKQKINSDPTYKRDFSDLIDIVYDLAMDQSNSQTQGQAIQLLGYLKDSRVMSILFDYSKNLAEGKEFPCQGSFSNWVMKELYSANRVLFLKNIFEIAKSNPYGASKLNDIFERV